MKRLSKHNSPSPQPYPSRSGSRWLCCLAILWMSPFARADEGVVLIDQGQARCNIVLPADAPEVAKFAASELAARLKQMTGADVPVVDTKKTGTLAIDFQLRPWRDEAFETTVDDAGITLKAGERALLPATYALLESLGCRFLAPDFEFYDGHASLIPHQPTLAPSRMDAKTTKPRFTFRKLYVEEGRSHNEQNLRELIDWMPKGGFNTLVVPMDYQNHGKVKWDNWRAALTPELKKRRIIIEVGGHGYQNFMNAKTVADGKTLFDVHPDWFGLDEKGKRDAAETRVFCTSNEQAFAFFQKQVEDYAKARPEIEIFDLWPPDGATWCECDQCRALGEPQDRQALLMNRMQNAFRAFGGPRLEMIAYSKALLPPTRQMLDPSILVDFCPINQQFEKQINDDASERNKEYADALVAWRKQFVGDISLYSYYRKYAWRSLPCVIPQYIQHDMQWYATLPLQGISSYCEPADWGTYELQSYAIGKLGWDVNANVDQMIDTFCQARYGKFSAVASKTLVELGKIVSTTGSIRFTTLKSPETIAAAHQRIGELQSQVTNALQSADPVEHAALGRLELMLGYAGGDLQALHDKASNAPVDVLQRDAQSVAEYFQGNVDRGVFMTTGSGDLARFQRQYGLPAQGAAE